ncbi:hypothetical protein B0H10DRAFT_612181 [Mycena sp. CBHHK59/15]|nr:hypothetical protein B0H10DRAFT_612181 [Mycena sp. CBHHK59/15]
MQLLSSTALISACWCRFLCLSFHVRNLTTIQWSARMAEMGVDMNLAVSNRYSTVSCLYFVPYILLCFPLYARLSLH